MPRGAPTPTARDLFTDEQIEEFLALIRQGIGRHLAAQRIGATGSLIRSLCREARDPWFAKRFAEAVEEGREFYEERLRAESRTRALDSSDRMLEVELATHVPEYVHLRRDRMKVNGSVQHEHTLTISIDPAVLDTWEPEKLEQFRAYLVELNGETVDAEVHELPPADAA